MKQAKTAPEATAKIRQESTLEKPDSHRIRIFSPDLIAFGGPNDSHEYSTLLLFDGNYFGDNYFNTLVAKIKLSRDKAVFLRDRLSEYLTQIEETK